MLKVDKRLSMEGAKSVLDETGFTDGFLYACDQHADILQIKDKQSLGKIMAFALAMFANGYDVCRAQNENTPT